MAHATDAQLKAAEVLGREMLETEPRAAAAHYDTATNRIVVDLVNGCSYVFPVQLVQDLQGASQADLALIEVDGLGFNLNWPALDVDLYVPALVSGIFGTRAWMVRELARSAGRTTSPAKASAARTNGTKGGRPRKISAGGSVGASLSIGDAQRTPVLSQTVRRLTGLAPLFLRNVPYAPILPNPNVTISSRCGDGRYASRHPAARRYRWDGLT